jgi:hypothetical protein
MKVLNIIVFLTVFSFVNCQCWIDKDGKQYCNNIPHCTINEDGTKTCVV